MVVTHGTAQAGRGGCLDDRQLRRRASRPPGHARAGGGGRAAQGPRRRRAHLRAAPRELLPPCAARPRRRASRACARSSSCSPPRGSTARTSRASTRGFAVDAGGAVHRRRAGARACRPRWLLVGRDFRFGAARAGDFAMLEDAARRRGFALEAMPEVTDAGERISSSRVREALERAATWQRAARLLGRPYADLAGAWCTAHKLGRSLGFPTANIALPRRPPLAGIFVVEAQGADAASAAAGCRAWRASGGGLRSTRLPAPLLEVHLFDFADGALRAPPARALSCTSCATRRNTTTSTRCARRSRSDVAQAKDYFVTTHG